MHDFEWDNVWQKFTELWPGLTDSTDEERASYQRVCDPYTETQVIPELRWLKDSRATNQAPMPGSIRSRLNQVCRRTDDKVQRVEQYNMSELRERLKAMPDYEILTAASQITATCPWLNNRDADYWRHPVNAYVIGKILGIVE